MAIIQKVGKTDVERRDETLDRVRAALVRVAQLVKGRTIDQDLGFPAGEIKLCRSD